MGKRKHYDDDEEKYLERKIKKLRRQKSKIRRRRRHHSYNSTPSDSSRSTEQNYAEYHDQIYVDEHHLQEDSQNEETPGDKNGLDTADTGDSPTNTAGIQSVVVQTASAAPSLALHAPLPTPTSTAAPPALGPADKELCADTLASPLTATELSIELESDILCLLGEEPPKEEKFGPCIHKDVASRWSNILVNGLKDEVKEEITKSFDIPNNLKLVQAPVINPEIKAACNENVLKRDNILVDKQKILANAITGVANTVSTLLTSVLKDDDYKNQILKTLSDTGRLLCHIHFFETQARRAFLLSCLNKEVKDNIKDLKRDDSLFGKDLQESLRSMKAITKTGAELRPPVVKQKVQPRSKQVEPSTTRSLNWRGQPLPAPPPPRRAPARSNSTRGGHKPPPPPRRQSDRRAPSAHSRSLRR